MREGAAFAVTGFDHIVLAVADIAKTRVFYESALGMESIEHQPGKWALAFGDHKISLQSVDAMPDIAKNTTAGSGNFCVLTDRPIQQVIEHLEACGVDLLEGPVRKQGAVGPMMSVYFRDPDGNLVEVSEPLT